MTGTFRFHTRCGGSSFDDFRCDCLHRRSVKRSDESVRKKEHLRGHAWCSKEWLWRHTLAINMQLAWWPLRGRASCHPSRCPRIHRIGTHFSISAEELGSSTRFASFGRSYNNLPKLLYTVYDHNKPYYIRIPINQPGFNGYNCSRWFKKLRHSKWFSVL